jgi:hypothetical protein
LGPVNPTPQDKPPPSVDYACSTLIRPSASAASIAQNCPQV